MSFYYILFIGENQLALSREKSSYYIEKRLIKLHLMDENAKVTQMEKSRRICEDYEKGELLNAMRHEECCTARARKMSIQKNKVTSRKR